MEFREDLTGNVLTRDEVLNKENNPKPNSIKDLEALGYAHIKSGKQPNLSNAYETIERIGVVQEADGNWYEKYRIGPHFTDTKDSDGKVIKTAAENEAEYKKNVDDHRAERQREERNQKLADSDWTQLADSALASDKKTEWVAYRKALRDLPTSSGSNWPHKVTFPTAPS
tara:strand:+ start:384 stop:893 length:510 start_codon:yes stop_codon:yes gene_type:complete